MSQAPSNRIINGDMTVQPRQQGKSVFSEEYEWRTHSQPGPRILLAVIRKTRSRTRRAQRHHLHRVYADTTFSCQYRFMKDVQPEPKINAEFSGRQIKVTVEGSDKPLFFTAPQLNWIAK